MSFRTCFGKINHENVVIDNDSIHSLLAANNYNAVIVSAV
jgi:hypothetical protein